LPRPQMTVWKWMIVVAIAAMIFALDAWRRRQDAEPLEILTRMASSQAKNDLGDISRFNITARWVGSYAQVDFVPKEPEGMGRRYILESWMGETVSNRPLSKP